MCHFPAFGGGSHVNFQKNMKNTAYFEHYPFLNSGVGRPPVRELIYRAECGRFAVVSVEGWEDKEDIKGQIFCNTTQHRSIDGLCSFIGADFKKRPDKILFLN